MFIEFRLQINTLYQLAIALLAESVHGFRIDLDIPEGCFPLITGRGAAKIEIDFVGGTEEDNTIIVFSIDVFIRPRGSRSRICESGMGPNKGPQLLQFGDGLFRLIQVPGEVAIQLFFGGVVPGASMSGGADN